MFLALIKKYIDQNGGKSQFALTAVTPGTPINPAFPLVKVQQQQFQLIPVQDPPDSSDVKTEKESPSKHYNASDLTTSENDVKTETNSPEKKGKTSARHKTLTKYSFVCVFTRISVEDQKKSISLRQLSAPSPTKPTTQATEQAAAKQEDINIAPADASRNPGSIANQVAIRQARQPVVKKKEKPTKIKKARASVCWCIISANA